ncbi:MAG: N-formylglutamate amidohydrolase [Cytophagales bacterium]
MRPVQLVISSEHSGNEIPAHYASLFESAGAALNSHRGIDFGSAEIAKTFKEAFKADLFETKVSRLLVDCNRSLHRKDLFSEFSGLLDEPAKKVILDNYYYPHRKNVEKYVKEHFNRAMVLHLSIHTFTPYWNEIERAVDIGLLFDELRAHETVLCTFWEDELKKQLPSKKILHNSPYTGAEDGLTAHLRKLFPDDCYMGIEIEVNQKYANTDELKTLCMAMIDALRISVGKMNSSFTSGTKSY